MNPTANAMRYNPYFNDGYDNVPQGISRLCDEVERFVDFMNDSDNLNEDNMQTIYYFLRRIDDYIINLTYNRYQLTESVKIMCMRRLNPTHESLMIVVERYNIETERKSNKSLKKKKTRSSSKSKSKSKSKSSHGGKRSRRK